MTRSLFFILIVIGLTCVVVDHKKISYGLGVRMLNYQMPSTFEPLLKMEQYKPKTREEIRELNKYVRYFESAHKYFPERADILSTLAFCYVQQQKWRQALIFYQKAITIKPRVSVFYYNVGVIQMKLGHTKEAQQAFIRARQVPLKSSYTFLKSSQRIFRLFLGHFLDPDKELINRIKAIRLKGNEGVLEYQGLRVLLF